MTEKRQRTPEEYGRLIGRHEAGQSIALISREMKIPHSTVSNAIKRFKKTGTAVPAKRTGRPEKLSDSDKEYLALCMRRAPDDNVDKHSASLNAAGVDISRKTLAKHIRELGYVEVEQELDE